MTEMIPPQSLGALNTALTMVRSSSHYTNKDSPNLRSEDFATIRHNHCYKTKLITTLPAKQHC